MNFIDKIYHERNAYVCSNYRNMQERVTVDCIMPLSNEYITQVYVNDIGIIITYAMSYKLLRLPDFSSSNAHITLWKDIDRETIYDIRNKKFVYPTPLITSNFIQNAISYYAYRFGL